MAPPKIPKKPLKSMEKSSGGIQPRPISKKVKKKNFQNYSIYMYKLLKSTAQEKMGISRKSMVIMNNFVYDMMEKIALEAGRLISHSKKTTLSSREVQTAIRLLIPGELAKHANMDALKAISMYHNS